MLHVFPVNEAEINQLAGVEVTPLDMRFSYSREDVLSLFQTLQEAGRAKYQYVSSIIDMMYPLLYGVLLFLLLKKLIRSLPFAVGRLTIVCFLPIIAAVFDFIENFNVIGMLKSFPSITDTQVFASSLATSTKWTFLAASQISVVVLAAIHIVVFISRTLASRKRSGQVE
ncbi:hypothetical protein CSA80_02855 [Candidatus Saccharibacteria bacterium]|nr:MAG: hypothetical protein CSA80_02855 [Candidatus Saccharibacteria bacterium]